MKNINLDLVALKESLNNVIDSRISKVKNDEAIKNINNFSFIECQQLFENIVDKLYDSGKGKSYIKKYVTTLKESKELNSLYRIYDYLRLPNSVKDSKTFVNENINIANSLNKKNVSNGLNELRKCLKESSIYLKLNAEDVNGILENNKELNESINFILNNKKSIKNLEEYTNHVSHVYEHVENNKEIIKENSELNNSSVDDLSELFESHNTEWENKVVEDITLYEIAGKSKEGLFESYKNDCLTLINESLEESENIETTNRLQLMQEQLNRKEYSEDTVINDILKLAELKNTLSE